MTEMAICTEMWALLNENRGGRMVQVSFSPVGQGCISIGGGAFLCRRIGPGNEGKWMVFQVKTGLYRQRHHAPYKGSCITMKDE
jgi:hypothetical protein